MTDRNAAIVTGAGSGIGRCLALQLADEGWAVALAGRTKAKLNETAAEIAQRTGDEAVLVQPTDLTNADQCDALVVDTEKRFGRLDALANVAGYAALAPIRETSDEMWRTTFEANVTSVVNMSRSAWDAFERNGGGVIANVSSMAAFDPFPGFAAYATAKAAVNMFTRVTGSEGERIGLRAVCLAPGAVETGMLRGLFDEKQIPPSAAADPEDVAGAIRECILGRRQFTSGETIKL